MGRKLENLTSQNLKILDLKFEDKKKRAID